MQPAPRESRDFDPFFAGACARTSGDTVGVPSAMNVGQLSLPDRQASFVAVQPRTDGRPILEALRIPQPGAVVVVCDGAASLDDFERAHPDVRAQLSRLVTGALAQVAVSSRAMVLTGGVDAGVAAKLGRALATLGAGATTLGVARASEVHSPGEPAPDGPRTPLEPNHDHFVLVEGERPGDEAAVLASLAAAAVARASDDRRGHPPVVVVLIHGDDESAELLLHAARRRWPIVVVKGTGGLADTLAAALARAAAPPDDPRLIELLAGGTFHVVATADDPATVRHRLAELLDPDAREELLLHAWSTFARFDGQAIRHQREFRRLQLAISLVGLFAVLVAVSMAYPRPTWISVDLAELGNELLRYIALTLPIALSVMMAASSRFKLGSKWVLMRGAAEAIKREIFLFRACSGDYAEARCRETPRTARFATRLAGISRRVMATTVNEAAMPAYTGPIPPRGADAGGRDDGLADLDAHRYLELRLVDQLDYFSAKTATLERQLRRLSWAIYAIGGLGTLLAALDGQPLIALTTATAAAIANYLEWQQTEYSLVKYNQARADLENLRNWWQALTPAQHADPAHASLLVAQTEHVLDLERTGWIQQMQDLLTLRQPAPQPKGAAEDGHE